MTFSPDGKYCVLGHGQSPEYMTIWEVADTVASWTQVADPATAPANHSNLVNFDEDAMVTGVEMYVQMAMHHLATAD